tara:strand:+ start:14427 stop:14948 length:522 start_codon:yes stop_codon:yes gene_type:complete
MKKLIPTTILVALVLLTTDVFAQGRPLRGDAQQQNPQAQFNRGNAERGPEQMMRALDLTEDQQEQVKQLHLETQKAMLSIQNQLNEKEAKLKTLTTGENADFKAASKVVEEIGDLKTEIAINRLETHSKIRALLTDEQKLKFDTISMRRNKGPKGLGERGGQRGPRNGPQPRN